MLARHADAVAALALALLLAALLQVAYATSITSDETAEIGAGVSAWSHREVAIFEEHPPLVQLLAGAAARALGVAPRSAEEVWPQARRGPLLAQWGWCERVLFHDNPEARLPFARPGLDSIVTAARLPVLAFPLLLALVAYLWAKARFGPHGGLLALALAITYPDLLGHGALVATDVPFAALALLASFALDRRLAGGGRAWVALAGAACGLAIATRLWGPVLALALAVAAGKKRWRETLAASAVAALVLWAAYLGANPIGCYVHGVQETLKQHGEAHDAVLLGHMTRGPHYLLVAGLLKLPLGTIALLAVTAFLARREWRSPLHLPALAILAVNSTLAAPYGTRYLLPVVPFLIVSAGRLAEWARGSRRRLAFVALALASNLAVVAREQPYHVGSTNLLVRRPWRALDNSNTDWGQGVKALARWQREHGDVALAVVARAATPFRLLPPAAPGGPERVAASCDFRIAALDAYGVLGRVEPGEALFHPRRGVVYAVSEHVLARAPFFETDAPLLWPSGAVGPARLVLGAQVEPTDRAGDAFLIFDLRGSATR